MQITDDMITEQLALEEEMVSIGAARLEEADKAAAKRGDASASTGYRFLTRHLVEPAAEAIKARLHAAATAESYRPSRTEWTAKLLQSAPAETLALITLRSFFDTYGSKQAPLFTSLAIRCGTDAELEIRMEAFRKMDKKHYLQTLSEMRDRDMDKVGRNKIADRFSKQQTGIPDWETETRLIAGTLLLSAVQKATGLFRLTMPIRKGKKEYAVELVETAEVRAANAVKWAAAMSPSLMPTIIPPLPWATPYAGGYYSPPIQDRYALVKTNSRALLQEMEGEDMSRVYAAVNAAQATPWRVNERVMGVLREAVEKRMAVANIPDLDLPIPPLTPEIAACPERGKLWKREAAILHDERIANRGRIMMIERAIKLAERFAGRDFYFPHQCDFRGRIYPMPHTLNPQGPDYVKALLTFARGYPIEDERAVGWLAVSGANHYGIDKAPFQDRIDWTFANSARICAVEADPFGPEMDFWTKADAPWQFLAFCFEWGGFIREGYGFVSSLPVGLDGSCNGLQHYSAALRDPEGAEAVNLTPRATPNDIYGVVAKRVLEHLADYSRPNGPSRGRFPWLRKVAMVWTDLGISPSDFADAWKGIGIDRKVAKRPVMTLPYGSTQRSVKQFIQDALTDKLAGRENPFMQFMDAPAKTVVSRASLFLTPFMWQAIGETVTAARVGMEWLKDCARAASVASCPITWRTPDGFLVQQAYRVMDSVQIRTVMQGSVIKPRIRRETLAIDDRKQGQGIAPNWVHSMDACALRMFVTRAAEQGLHDFALVHDSYGAPAAKVDLMARCLREAFISLYSDHDPITDFYFDLLEQVPDYAVNLIPEPPKKGTLDLSQVLEADYFFA